MGPVIWYPGYDLQLEDIVRAENCYLFDGAGNRYVDLESGVWCTPLGHGHPRILRVLQEQSARIAHTGFVYGSRIVAESAREILSLVGLADGRCAFLCSGSEAVEYGVRTVQLITARPLLMTMADSYFGAYGSARTRLASEWYSFGWMACADCPATRECDAGCPRWRAIPREMIGGFLFEPGSSSGLVRFPPAKLIRAIVRFIREDDGLVLVNEVTTGVGRTGKWFGYQHYDLTPDVVALGKGIGNGYPVSVALLGPRVMQRLAKQELKYSQSHQNDPLGAAIAREVVHVVQEEGLIERSRALGELLAGGLERIRTRTEGIRAFRARGLMVAIDLADDAEASRSIRVQRELLRRGYVLARRPGLSVLRIDPALTIARDELEGFLSAFEDVLSQVVA